MSTVELHVGGRGTVFALGDPDAVAAVAMAIRHRQELLDAIEMSEGRGHAWAVAARVREEMES